MISLIAYVIGAVGAIWYIGFFAYKVEALPLTVIVAVCLALMVYSFYDDARNDRAVAQARSENGSSQ